LATFTVRHQASDHVSLTREVRACWRSLLQRRKWRLWSKQHGAEWICAEEITRGDNGWHPHLHTLLMPQRDIDAEEAGGEFFEDWHDTVERRLGPEHCPSWEHGVDLRPCDSATYVTKIGLELTDVANAKGRSPLALLEDAANGDPRGLELYVQLQRERRRARDLSWSRGLKSIRDSLPDRGEPALLLELRGSEWGRLRQLNALAALTVAEQAEPELARAAVERMIGPIDGDTPELTPIDMRGRIIVKNLATRLAGFPHRRRAGWSPPVLVERPEWWDGFYQQSKSCGELPSSERKDRIPDVDHE
ncbi:MAG TPA: hypothetical protein VM756_10570, partial [Burkholderiales bacterium]|nr:hypothetical protein [Burkholderiales bacterium]